MLSLWDKFDLLGGGAAGGGKSDWLLMEALQWVQEPGYAGIIFRKTYTDLSLPGGLMDRAREWLAGTDALWQERDKRWVFPKYGSSLSFGYLEHRGSERRYQSAEFQFIGIDQVDDFEDDRQVHFLKSRLRRAAESKLPIRFRCTANPGGPGHAWILNWYIGEKRDLKERHYWMRDHGDGRLSHLVFAVIADNPSLDREQYTKESLAHLPSAERRQLLEGDWWAFRGGEFMRREWFVGIIEDTQERRQLLGSAPPLTKRVRFWDLAASETETAKYTVGLRMGRTAEGLYVIDDIKRGRWTAGKRDEIIEWTAKMDGHDTRQYVEQEPGSGGVAQIEQIKNRLTGYRVHGRLPKGKKVARVKPFAAEAEKGKVKLVNAEWNQAFLDEIESCREDGKATYMDQVDAASGAFEVLNTSKARIAFI